MIPIQIQISKEDLLKWKAAGKGELHIFMENTDTGEKSEAVISISIEQIDQMLRTLEAGERASRN